MIREQLLDFKYYLDRLSIFMKESYGIAEHVDIFFQQLAKANEAFDEFFRELDIFDLNREDEKTSSSAILDKLGAIFGCYRSFTVNVPAHGNVAAASKMLSLSDEEFSLYIKCQIAKQNFNGTRSELTKVYTTYENGVKTQDALLPVTFIYVLYQITNVNPPTLNATQCQIYWSDAEEWESENLEDLFLAGYLTIESMGINYKRLLQNIEWLGIFADYESVKTYSNGDYYSVTIAGDTTYYVWTIDQGWTAQDSPGSGTNLGSKDSTSDIPNYGTWHNFGDENDEELEGGHFA